MGLSHRSGAELVVCKCVMEFSEVTVAGRAASRIVYIA